MKPWKVQKFASDVVYDLRNRGLLPWAIFLVIAIVAAPILIAKSSSSEPLAPLGQPADAAAGPAPEGQAAVVAYSPGVRNYRKRLEELASKDPFKQQFAASPDSLKQAGNAIDSGSSASAAVGSDYQPLPTGSSGNTGGSTGGGGSDGGGSGKTKTQTYYFSYQTELLVGDTSQPLVRRNKVPDFTLLPSEAVPVLVFLGAAADGKQAIFSVSRKVTGVSGSGLCYPEPDDCELLGLERGEGADLAYNGKTYRVEVAQIKRVKSSKPQG